MMNAQIIIWMKKTHQKPYHSPALCKSLPLLNYRAKMNIKVGSRDQGMIVSVAVPTTSETRVETAERYSSTLDAVDLDSAELQATTCPYQEFERHRR